MLLTALLRVPILGGKNCTKVFLLSIEIYVGHIGYMGQLKKQLIGDIIATSARIDFFLTF